SPQPPLRRPRSSSTSSATPGASPASRTPTSGPTAPWPPPRSSPRRSSSPRGRNEVLAAHPGGDHLAGLALGTVIDRHFPTTQEVFARPFTHAADVGETVALRSADVTVTNVHAAHR